MVLSTCCNLTHPNCLLSHARRLLPELFPTNRMVHSSFVSSLLVYLSLLVHLSLLSSLPQQGARTTKRRECAAASARTANSQNQNVLHGWQANDSQGSGRPRRRGHWKRRKRPGVVSSDRHPISRVVALIFHSRRPLRCLLHVHVFLTP